MRACTFATQANALTFVAGVNAALGYPRNGVNAATGVVETRFGQTATWGAPFRHPTDVTKWAVAYKDRLQKLTTAAVEAYIVSGTIAGSLNAKQRAELVAEIAPSSLTQAQYDALKAKLLTSVSLSADWFA